VKGVKSWAPKTFEKNSKSKEQRGKEDGKQRGGPADDTCGEKGMDFHG